MRSKMTLVSIVLAGALALTSCGGTEQKENQEEPKSTESTANAETGREDGKAKESFAGVSWSEEEDEKYAISKGDDYMCIDTDNGGVYYVNWGRDKYLYYWKDGKNKLILDKWVSQIAYMNGKIYCLYDESGKTYTSAYEPSYEGVIMEIDAKTGKYKELTEKTALRLAVTKDRIYYNWFTGPDAEEQKSEDGFYSFGDKKIHKVEDRNDDANLQERFGKYAIVPRVNGKNKEIEHYVIDLETKEEKGVIETGTVSGTSVSQEYRLGEKWLFHSNGAADVESDEMGTETGTWWSVDMTTGEKKQIKTESLESTISSFVPVGDLLYAIPYSSYLDGKLAVYDEEKEEIKSVDIIDPKGVITSEDGSTYSKPVDVTDLRTDGRYLYTRGDGLKVLEVRDDGVYVIWSQSQMK